MSRWVFAVAVVLAVQVAPGRIGVAAAGERPILEQLALLRNGDSGTSRHDSSGAERHAQARTCKAVSSCEEAVRLWCGGYRRADGDNDGIPCENVCSSLSEVEAIKAEIGC